VRLGRREPLSDELTGVRPHGRHASDLGGRPLTAEQVESLAERMSRDAVEPLVHEERISGRAADGITH
jgi:hypothetical protein